MLTRHRFEASLVLALALCGVPHAAAAQTTAVPDLARASLEDLMTIQITSAARKEQRVDEVAAAVFVLTQDDIRRSGMRTLPELFRLVPGVQVAQINSSNWAVSIRGFNDQFSNKLLVLIDGRSIYKRVFSGVFWDAEDLVLDDIERIEVIRGPGAAVWGANAVNGVINIVTRTAKASQGTLLRLDAGTFDRTQATARYGGSFGRAAYRVYSQWTDRGNTRLAGDAPDDNWSVLTGGARIDWTRGSDEWTVDGSARAGNGHTIWKVPSGRLPDLSPRTEVESSFHTGNVLTRWTHRGASGSSLQVQSSAGILHRTDLVVLDETTFDADVQYHIKAGARHDVVAGSGYRFVNSTTGANFAVSFDRPRLDTFVANVFVQDEIALANGLHLTLGSKVEHASFSQWGVQPTVRIMWAPTNRQHVWAAVSRALRTPSLTDLALRFHAIVVPGESAPIAIGSIGNPEFRAESLVDVETGYRLAIGKAGFVDLTAFRGHYSDLPTSEPLAPVLEIAQGLPQLFVASRFENWLQADTRGIEVAAHFTPLPAWRVDGSYSTFHLTPHPDAGSQDPAVRTTDGNAAARQWQVSSSLALGSRTDVHGTLLHTGRLANIAIPAYTRVDAGVTVALTSHLSAVAAGRNLTQAWHVEFASPVVVATQVPRNVTAQLVWRY